MEPLLPLKLHFHLHQIQIFLTTVLYSWLSDYHFTASLSSLQVTILQIWIYYIQYPGHHLFNLVKIILLNYHQRLVYVIPKALFLIYFFFLQIVRKILSPMCFCLAYVTIVPFITILMACVLIGIYNISLSYIPRNTSSNLCSSFFISLSMSISWKILPNTLITVVFFLKTKNSQIKVNFQFCFM